MSTTTAKKDEEELLIISDDTDIEEELNTDAEMKIEEELGDENIISFGDDSLTESEKGVSDIAIDGETDTGVNAVVSQGDELDLNFDLGDDNSEVTVEELLAESDKEKSAGTDTTSTNSKTQGKSESNGGENTIEKVTDSESEEDIFNFTLDESGTDLSSNEKEIKLSQNEEADTSLEETNSTDLGESFSFDIGDEIKEEETKEEDVKVEDELDEKSTIDITDSENENMAFDIEEDLGTKQTGVGGISGDDDVNTILDEAIAKHNARKEKIAEIKFETMDEISKLSDEIKSLQAKVKIHKTDVKDLDTETKKIEENVSELEKMKIA